MAASGPASVKGAPPPTGLRLRRGSRILEVSYADGTRFELPWEYLRVHSPSAEVWGHGLPEPVLVPGKRGVGVLRIEPVGQYAVRLVFDDGHDSGLFSWEVLWDLGQNLTANWARYLERLQEHGLSRDSSVTRLSALGPPRWKPPG